MPAKPAKPEQRAAMVTLRMPLQVTAEESAKLKWLHVMHTALPVPMHTMTSHAIMFNYVPYADPRQVSYAASSYLQLLNRIAMKAMCDCVSISKGDKGEEYIEGIVEKYEDVCTANSEAYETAVREAGGDRGKQMLAMCTYAKVCTTTQLDLMHTMASQCALTGPGAGALLVALVTDRAAVEASPSSLDVPTLAEMGVRGVISYAAEVTETAGLARMLRKTERPDAPPPVKWGAPDVRPWSELIDPSYVDEEVTWLLRDMQKAGDLTKITDEKIEAMIAAAPKPPGTFVLPARAVKGELRMLFPDFQTYI